MTQQLDAVTVSTPEVSYVDPYVPHLRVGERTPSAMTPLGWLGGGAVPTALVGTYRAFDPTRRVAV